MVAICSVRTLFVGQPDLQGVVVGSEAGVGGSALWDRACQKLAVLEAK
jgi:hypothetical protein